MRAVERELPASAADGLSASALAVRVHGPDRTLQQEKSIAGAARRLVERGVAASAQSAHGRTVVYYRAPDEPAPAPMELGLGLGTDGGFEVCRWTRVEEQVLPAIERLKGNERQLMLLQLVEGRSIDEIAQTLGITVQKALVLRQRAAAKIRNAVLAAAAMRE
jgi:DNA-directed RNA polymerase specialized sigma24 family protein